MRLVPVTYRAKRIRGKLAWVNVYALANVGCAAGAVVVAGAAISMLGTGTARAQAPCNGGTDTVSSSVGAVSWGLGNCTITSSGTVTTSASISSGSNFGVSGQATSLGTLSNSGTIQTTLTSTNAGQVLAAGLGNGGTVTSISNAAGGLITGQFAGTMTPASYGNSFTIAGLANLAAGTIQNLSNSGVISAYNTGTFSSTVVNTIGVAFVGVQNEGLIGTLTNMGTILGTIGGAYSPSNGGPVFGIGVQNQLAGTIANLTNATGALIKASAVGIENSANIGTVTNNGVISSNRFGVELDPGGTVGALTNQGTITAFIGGAVLNGGVLETLTNTNLLTSTAGQFPTVFNQGQIGTLTNTGTIYGPGYGLYNASPVGVIGTLTNSGTITGSMYAIENTAGASIGTLDNQNSIGGLNGIYNTASALIGTLVNQGLIQGANNAIENGGNVATLANAVTGSIIGNDQAGVNNLATGTIGTLTNLGLMQSAGAAVNNLGLITTLDNSGILSGTGSYAGLYNSGTISNLINETSGTIQSGQTGINVYGTIGTLSNAGIIRSTNGYTAVLIQGGGTIGTLVNTGTLSGWTPLGINPGGAIGTLLNDISGTIATSNTGIYAVSNINGTIGSLINNGTISLANVASTGRAAVYNTGGGVISALSNNGLISSNAYGIADFGSTITTLDNSAVGTIVSMGTVAVLPGMYGPVDYPAAAVYNDATSSITSFSNEGTIFATVSGVSNAGAVTAMSNSGIIIAGNVAIRNTGSIGTINNALGGFISGGTIGLDNTGTLTAVTNAGVMMGSIAGLSNSGTIYSILNSGNINTLVNQGLINASLTGVNNQGSIGSLVNSGSIGSSGTGNGISNSGAIAQLVNSGSISGADAVSNAGTIGSLENNGTIIGAQIGVYNTGSIGTVTNAGLINGSGIGLRNNGIIDSIVNTGTISDKLHAGLVNSGTITSLTSQGLISGGFGLDNADGYIGTVSNTGTIVATGKTGVYSSGTIATLTNSGAIAGVIAGILVDSGGTIGALVNSGTVTGPTALAVASTGSLGTVTNSGTIAGAINNLSANDLNFVGGSGSTYGVFTGNSGGLGVADEGTITSTGANVVFLAGNILLNDNINVGTNTVTNSAVLQINNPLSITGSFHQTSGGNLVLGVTGISNYGNLTVSGTATIDANGNVSLTRLNGFSFAGGQTYTVVAAPNASYNVSSLNVAVSGYSGTTTVTQVQQAGTQELVICLNGTTNACSSGSSGGSSGGGSSGGGSSGGGSSGGGSSGGGSSGGGSSGGGSTGGSSGNGSTGGSSGGSSSTKPNHYSLATTSNAISTNDAIVGYAGNNAALINLANQIASLGSAAAANNAGNQLRADSHGPSSELAMQPALDVMNVVTAHTDETDLARLDSPSGVAAGENAAGWAPWSEALGSTGHQSTEGQFAGYGLSTEGILFGADKSLAPDVRIGALGSFTHAKLTDHGDLTGDGTGLDSYGLFGYGSYVGTRAYWDVAAGVMFDRFNTTRVVSVGDFQGAAFGKHDGLQEVAKAEGGFPFALNPQKTTSLSPLWGLEVIHLHQSAYDETGGSAAALAVRSSETWSVKSEIGAKLEHSIKATGATWVPELRVLWRHEFVQSATTQRESFLADETGSTEFTTYGPRPEVNTGLLEAGVTVLTHGDVSLAVRYQADVGSGYFDQGGRLRLRWDF